MSDPQTRRLVLASARRWIGTPYRHQASQYGAGTDCLGLIRGIWRELYGQEPERPPAYTPDWAEVNGEETMLHAAQRWLKPMDQGAIQPGDVMVFRMSADAPCKHVGVLASRDTLIHAYWGKSVVESHLVPYWRRRWTHSFSFPPLTTGQLS